MRVMEIIVKMTKEEMDELAKKTIKQMQEAFQKDIADNAGVEAEKFYLNFRLGDECVKMFIDTEEDEVFEKIKTYVTSKGCEPKELP